MEDKVLWIALKLFMVWLFVMAFCLCICNCLFIRSDRQKSKEAKLAAARAILERHKRLNRQCCDCEEEKLVGSVGGTGVSRGHHQTHLHLTETEQQQLTAQVSSGLAAQSAYIQRAATPRFTLQHPSEDDVNLSQLTRQTSIDIDIGRETTDPVNKNAGRLSSELLLSLLRTPSGKYVLFGREERFPRIETASNPALNVEKFQAPSRKPYVTKKRFPQQPQPPPAPDFTALEKSKTGDSSRSNSNSSMALPQTPSFAITEVEGLERPRSSSFSGQDSSRHPSPYRSRHRSQRLTPSPTPTSSSLLGRGGNNPNPHSPLLPHTTRNNNRNNYSSGTSHGQENGHVVINISQPAQRYQIRNGNQENVDSLTPSSVRNTNGLNSNNSSSSYAPSPDSDSESQLNFRRSIVSDV